MSSTSQRTGKLKSGDVQLFYRAFGPLDEPGAKTPILILHGSNYFDSYDWIEVAEALAKDRPVAAFDRRGFGQSDWSVNKDYSLDALLHDITNVSAHFGWNRPVIMGHSMAGRLSIFFAAHFPENISHLIVLDSELDNANPGRYTVSVGNEPQLFASVEAAMASLAGKFSPPRFALDRARAELALSKLNSGYTLKRDPDHRNTQSQAPGAPMPKLRDLDVWESLTKVTCPITFIRGLQSDRNKREYYDRITSEFPHVAIESVDSRHDIAYEAPGELVEVVKRILD